MNKNIGTIIDKEKYILADLQEEEQELQEEMSSPDKLNEIGNSIKELSKQVRILEDISDFSKDRNTYHRGFEYNTEKFKEYLERDRNRSIGETRRTLNYKLETLAAVQTRINSEVESESSDNQNTMAQTSENQQNDFEDSSSIFDDID